jgi:hypothetical protein
MAAVRYLASGPLRAVSGVSILVLALTAAIGAGGALAQPADFPAVAPAGSGLLVTPTRLVFEGRKRSAELTLINRSDEAATYRIAFREMEMTRDGGLEIVEEEPPWSAERLIRYSPRQVTLGPHETQTVRLQLRLPAELADGEYRSHLELRYVPPPTEAAARRPQTEEEGEFQVRLVALYGVALPIIVRRGEPVAEVSIGDVELIAGSDGEPDELRLVIRRQGDRSVYGDLSVSVSSTDEGRREIGLVRGLAVYTPNTAREVGIPLSQPLRNLRGDTLELRYRDAEGSGTTLASARFRVP